MKNLSFILMITAFMVFLGNVAFADEMPGYLKDGEIVVTLKNGKQYKYSSNEYMVVKRGAKKKVDLTQPAQKAPENLISVKEKESHKTIVSVEVTNSQKGVSVSDNASETTVKTKNVLGVGLQLHHNIYESWYLGGRADTNGGASLSFGRGF